MANIDIKVPDIGDFAEVAVIELLVKVGDTVKAEQSLITVESDKASMEIPSSHAGVITGLSIKIGDKVKEGSVIMTMDVAGATNTVRPELVEGFAEASTGSARTELFAPATSIVMMTEPSLTLSPILMLKPVITPAWLEGISIDALSDSTVIKLCSALTVSPTLTSNSMTATSAKSPISGTLMSIFAMLLSL